MPTKPARSTAVSTALEVLDVRTTHSIDDSLDASIGKNNTNTYIQYTVDTIPKHSEYAALEGAKQMLSTILLEPSWADVAAAIEQPELPVELRSQWLCSLRKIAKAIGRPMDAIAARWTSTRFAIQRLHPVALGMNPKTLSNHKANVKAALRWFADEKDLPKRGSSLSPEWHALRQRLVDRRARSVLSSSMRFWSAKLIAPADVDERALDDYMAYRGKATRLATNDAARRCIARAWNGCIDVVEEWPERPLREPPIKGYDGPAWADFSEEFRAGVDAYVTSLTKVRRDAKGKRIRPCKPSTIRTRRAEIVAAARVAVKIGIPIASLALPQLLHPDVAGPVIDEYWNADGEEPSTYTIDLGWKFLAMARRAGCFGENELERLDDIRASLEMHRRGGLTEKNQALIRQVLSGDVWKRVINLAAELMEQARSTNERAPIKAAVTAQLAAALGILTFAPVRLSNLAQIRLDQNLIRPGGPDAPFMLVFPHYDVKNRVDLEFQFDEELTAVINEYVRVFRSTLLRDSNDLWLFPGESGGCKDAKTLSDQISNRVKRATGLSVTVHQFRHAAAAIWLRHHPGDYETVRRTLGHRDTRTTTNFYCGLETLHANIMFGDLVRKLQSGPETSRPEATP